MVKVISISEAKQLGERYYFTGRPCKNNNVNKRRVSDSRCVCDKCRDENKKRCKQWGQKNSVEKRIYSRNYGKDNKARIKKRRCKSYLNKANEYRARKAKRRASEMNSKPSWFSELDDFVIKEAYSLAKERSCIGFNWHVDHMIPLQAVSCSGLHCYQNIQVIPAEINLSKNNKMIFTKPFCWV